MNESIITLHSAWKVKWLPNRTEADQGSERRCIYNVRIRTVHVDVLLSEASSVLCGQ